VRLICYDLELPFSGPKHVLIPRVLRQSETEREAGGADGSDVSEWWLFRSSIKLATLQSACVDLGVSKQGSKPHLRRRILANVGAGLHADEHDENDEDDVPGANNTAAKGSWASASGHAGLGRSSPTPQAVTLAKRGPGRPRKNPAEGAGVAVAGGRDAPAAGCDENPWDAVQCQRCGNTDRENKMILCDECDGGYHFDTCAYPRLDAIPRGAWYCYECQKRRKKADELAAKVESAPVLSVAKSGRERKGIQRFRPRLGV